MNKNKNKSKEMLQYNSTKRNKIKLTGYDNNDKFSDIDTGDDDDKTVLKIPTYESDDGTSTKEIVEGSNNKELQKNQFSSPSSNQNNDQYLVVESDRKKNGNTFRSLSPDLLLHSPGFSPSTRTTNTINLQYFSANSSRMSNHLNKIKRSPFKTPTKKIESARKQLFVNSDKQFKEFIHHSVILLKHNMRNLDEKLTMLLEHTKKNYSYINDSNDKETIDHSHLDCFFPICDETTLNAIEEQLSVDKIYNTEMKNKLIGLGGKTVNIFVK
ncbi:hypothetical protein ACI65C_006495 [Semiaphis heraclei]